MKYRKFWNTGGQAYCVGDIITFQAVLIAINTASLSPCVWHGDKCGEAYKSFNSSYNCIRMPICQSNARDWYEPCEPTLHQDGLPDDYFMCKRP